MMQFSLHLWRHRTLWRMDCWSDVRDKLTTDKPWVGPHSKVDLLSMNLVLSVTAIWGLDRIPKSRSKLIIMADEYLGSTLDPRLSSFFLSLRFRSRESIPTLTIFWIACLDGTGNQSNKYWQNIVSWGWAQLSRNPLGYHVGWFFLIA